MSWSVTAISCARARATENVVKCQAYRLLNPLIIRLLSNKDTTENPRVGSSILPLATISLLL